MTTNQNDVYRQKLEAKIHKYYDETPTAKKCIQYLMDKYPFIMPQIDHMAYRFLNEQEWKQYEKEMDSKYECRDRLDFPLKSTDKYYKHAHWYSHDNYPRTFASYIDILEEDKLTIKEISESNTTDNVKYDKLKQIDQYMAWTSIWKEDINHLAFELSDYPDDFEAIINNMVKDLGLEMNRYGKNGNILMVSQDGLLRQCSTKSDLVDGIPKAYIEFVCRSKDENGIKRDGFDTFSANNIFESTD